MYHDILDLQIPIIFLITITFFLIMKDRSFSPKIRSRFYAILLCSAIFIFGNLLEMVSTEFSEIYNGRMRMMLQLAIYPMMITLWLGISLQDAKKTFYRILCGACAVNAVLAITSLWTGLYFAIGENGEFIKKPPIYIPQIIFVIAMFAIIITTYKCAEKDDSIVHIVSSFIAAFILIAELFEYFTDVHCLMSNSMAVGISVYYYYLVIRVYKRDAITNLMTRHNLKYDMENMKNTDCSVSMIDIDNFKMINDKYGHKKGDEALAVIAKTLRENLLKGCRLYRYGGDEFAIISVGQSDEKINKMFENVNKLLEEKDYRISYGTAKHISGNNLEDTISEADNIMYENKIKVKSDDIWDTMTGLFNLRGFIDELGLLDKKAIQEGKKVGLIAIDMEHFSNINSVYGYVEGNLVIVTIAQIIKNCLDIREFAGHIGGDEFIVAYIVDENDPHYQKRFIERITTGIANSTVLSGKEYTIGINYADYEYNPLKKKSIETCVNQAIYLKKQKKENKRKTTYTAEDFEEKRIDAQEEALALDIIKNNKFRYTMQPIVSAKDGSIVAYEALMCTTTDPMLSPMAVLRYAAKNNKNYEIEKLTFQNVLERIYSDTDLPESANIFINSLPGAMLNDKDYNELEKKYKKQLKRLVIEITEQSQLTDLELKVFAERQKRSRFTMAIDDFGSGNSNTYTLLRYKPKVIKLDRLLISDIERNTKKQYFVNSIVNFAKENDMRVLAEGVETEEELKMVIRLQVDYIQGYITGKPSYVPIKEIDEDIRDLIIAENCRNVVEGKRKIYIANAPWDVSLVQLALDEYTGITVAYPEIKLIGNTDYTADMCIKVKSGLTCNMTLQDVKLNSIDDLPCIDLDDNVDLTIILEGNCSFNYRGIHVPKSSSLKIIGSGNLSITAKGRSCYGIGCGIEEAVGNITLVQSGKISIRLDGEYGIAIGGGIYTGGNGISIQSGEFDIYVAAVEAIAIGCIHGSIPIALSDLSLRSEFRVSKGIVIGSMTDNQDIEIENYRFDVIGSGDTIAGLGSYNPANGKIHLRSGVFIMSMRAKDVNFIGSKEGDVSVRMNNTNLHITSEGTNVLAFGSWNDESHIYIEETSIAVNANAHNVKVYGAKEENVTILANPPLLKINE